MNTGNAPAGARRPRVLHLAYEDPQAPGSGGGAVRTQMINDRLGRKFDVDVVSVAYPRAERYTRSGVTYDFLGPRFGSRFVRQIGYFALLPWHVARRGRHYDLVVEDFGAPISTVGVPRFTRVPVLGVAQWLFAEQKSRQYHLPFAAVERAGVRAHRKVIAVSSGMADQLRATAPDVLVDVVQNGLPDGLLHRALGTAARRNLLYVGRLDVEHKGLDLLLEAFDRIHPEVEHDLDVVGEGPGEGWLRSEIERRGLGARVHVHGRIDGDALFDLMADHVAIAMPSRYESFGMVAAEAAAVGTPVLAFDIDCLRELIPGDLRVAAFDVDAYAKLLRRVLAGSHASMTQQAALRAGVAHLSWDELADRQAQIYVDAMA